MKHEQIENLFFSRNHDFLYIYIPKQQNGSENTRATYKSGMKAFRTYVNSVAGISTNKFKFEDCTYDFLLDYRNHLHDVLHLSEKTANNRLATVKSYMNYASARDVSLQQYAFAVSQVPFYTVPKVQQPIIEDMDSLTALIGIPPNTKKGLRDKVIMSVLYDGGIRLNELVTMKVASLDLSSDEIRIKLHGKGNRERTDFLDTKTSALVRQYLQEYHPEMDPKAPFIYTIVKGERGAMSARNVQKLIKKYADKVRSEHNLPASVSPHTFRRTRGTMLYRDNVPIETVAIKLGHANTKTTRDHYTSPSHEQLRKLAAKRNASIPDVEPIWPDNEDEMSRILGL